MANLFYIKIAIFICTIFSSAVVGKTIKSEKIPIIYGPLTFENQQEMKEKLENLKKVLIQTKEIISPISSKNFLQTENQIKDHEDSFICKSCLWTFDFIQRVLLQKYGWHMLFDLVSVICSLGLKFNICHEYVHVYGPIVTESLIDHYLNGNYICTMSYMCQTQHFIKLNADDYAMQLLQDKPLNQTHPEIDETAPVWKVLQVTDIHVDLNYVEGSRGVCPRALCCRNETSSPEAGSPTITSEEKAGRWGFLGNCDIPLRTLESFCERVFGGKSREKYPDMVIWTGDNPGHDAYDSSAFKVAQLFTSYIKEKYNYTLPVYPSLGNHEKFPADEYYPFDDSKEKNFLKSYGDLWRDWIGEEAYQTFLFFGAYTKKHPNSNLRIVSTNCLLCDVLNFHLIRDPTDPQTQVEWLEGILRQAEKDGEIVYLISHIPPGDSAFLSECAKRYKAILDRFSYIIRGQFFGHTHFDEIKIMHEYFDQSKVLSVSYIAPSLTTYSFLNPSYRIFEIDSNTKIIKDYIQYRLNITKANLSPEEDPTWEVAYRASEFFNVTYLNDIQTLANFSQNILTDTATFNKIVDSFFSQGPLAEMYTTAKKMPKYLSCRFSLDIFSDYYKCIGYITWDPEEYAYSFLNLVDGSWFKKLPK